MPEDTIIDYVSDKLSRAKLTKSHMALMLRFRQSMKLAPL